MLHRTSTLNSSAWQRSHHQAPLLSLQPDSKAPPGKRRLKSRLALTVSALTVALVYSYAIFNAGMQAARHTEASDPIISPGKRHRKLETGMRIDEQQSVLAAEQGETAGVLTAVQQLLQPAIEASEEQQQALQEQQMQQQHKQLGVGALEGQTASAAGGSAQELQQEQQRKSGVDAASEQAGHQQEQQHQEQQQEQQQLKEVAAEQAQQQKHLDSSDAAQRAAAAATAAAAVDAEDRAGGMQDAAVMQEEQAGLGSASNAGRDAGDAAADATAAATLAQQQVQQEQQQAQGQQEQAQQQPQQQAQQQQHDGGDQAAMEAAEAGQTGRKSPYQQALESCTSLACLKDAAKQKRFRGQFLFPHFLIIGWQASAKNGAAKCATTSLFHHLKDHPSIITPIEKEPEFFSYDCQYDPENCPAEMQREYIEETLHLSRVLRHNAYRMAFEGSTHYAREGHRMAQGLRRVFPWVKLIASMREPISRYLSMLGHNLDKNTYTCLKKHDLFECLELELPWNNYTTPFSAWLEAYPRDQIMLLQYESLTAPEHEKRHLRDVKSFLGIDPELPASVELPHSNTRAARLGQEPEGWKMQRWQYERLVEIVRPDAQSIADIVTKHGFGDGQEWMANWEAAWKANLDACGADGTCSIH